MTLYALHALEVYLRTRKPAEFSGMSWNAFLAVALLHVAKLTFQPVGGMAAPAQAPDPLPGYLAFQHQILFRPFEKIAGCWTGEDWFVGTLAWTVPSGLWLAT